MEVVLGTYEAVVDFFQEIFQMIQSVGGRQRVTAMHDEWSLLSRFNLLSYF